MKIIAEAGINHNGELKLAKRLVNNSKEAGADIVKFQTFFGIERLKRYELTEYEFVELKRYCDLVGIDFMSTPHTLDVIDFVDELVNIHKVASPFLTNKEFLTRVADKHKPIILSVGSIKNKNGMATMKEIETALSWIPNADVTLMHCVSKYPCKYPHFERVEELKKFGKPVGVSDHSNKIILPKVPVIEKHIMLPDIECIDSHVSLYPKRFALMVKYSREGKYENICGFV